MYKVMTQGQYAGVRFGGEILSWMRVANGQG